MMMKSVKKKSERAPPKKIRRGNAGLIKNFSQRHKVALFTSFSRLLTTPFTTAMAVIVMSIALALAGSFYVLVSNAQHLVNSLQTSKQISLFLHQKATEEQAKSLIQELYRNQTIDKVTLITKQQALDEFKRYSGFGDALNALEENPLPIVLQVYPKESLSKVDEMTALFKQIENQDFVDFAQMDMDWVARLQVIVKIASRVVSILSFLLAFAVVFITGNTIRSELQERHNEVVLIKLVGGTNAFICLPFLYAGFWYGCLSGILAWCLIFLLEWAIYQQIEQLSFLYQSQFQLYFMSMAESALFVLFASTLGIVGAYLIASYQLRLLKPE